MHGAIATMSRNVRRIGIPATKKGRPNPAYAAAVEGPTMERLAKAGGSFTIGDDRQGTRVYHFHDTTIDRMYSRLTKRARGRGEEELLRSEYIALQRYRHHWHYAGLESGMGSVDLNRVFASDPGSMSHMAKSERQAHHRRQWRVAQEELGHRPGIVVDNVMCAETSLEVAGFSVGYNSRTQARDMAEQILREAGRKLARLWGIG